DGLHLDIEGALHRRPDLHLVGVGTDLESHDVVLFLVPHVLLGHQRPEHDPPGIAIHGARASSRARSAARSTTTRLARSTWYTDTWAGASTAIHGTFRDARRSGASMAAVTTKVRIWLTPRAARRPTRDLVRPSSPSRASTTMSSPAAILALTAARS